MTKGAFPACRGLRGVLMLLAPVIGIGGCAQSHEDDCGANALFASERDASYCVYRREAVVIEGGFSCPSSMRHRADIEDLVICSDSELSADELPQAICAMLDQGCGGAPPPRGAMAAVAPRDPDPANGKGAESIGTTWTPANASAGEPPRGTRWEPDTAPTCEAGVTEFQARCPNLDVLFVSGDGRDDGDGTAADPMSNLHAAIDRCMPAGCHLRIAEGTYDASEDVLAIEGCVHIEGGFRMAADGSWTGDGVASIIELGDGGIRPGNADSKATDALIERVHLRASEDVVGSVPGLLVVRDSAIDGGDGAFIVGPSDQRRSHVRICDTDIRGFEAISVGWGASDVVLQRVRAEADETALAINRGSWGVVARDCELAGGWTAVASSGGSHHITIERSVLRGGEDGLVTLNQSHDIRIADNIIYNGALPDPVPELDIEITGNSYGGP